MSAGAEVKHALLGAGIESSHSYERTHIDSVVATERMVDAYLRNGFSRMELSNNVQKHCSRIGIILKNMLCSYRITLG